VRSDLPLYICALLLRGTVDKFLTRVSHVGLAASDLRAANACDGGPFFSTKLSHARPAASDLRAVTTCARTMVEILKRWTVCNLEEEKVVAALSCFTTHVLARLV
jgi:hypothetical protein